MKKKIKLVKIGSHASNHSINNNGLKMNITDTIYLLQLLTMCCLLLQYVPPDLCICTFVLEQSLSVRALQEMLAKSGQNSEGVSESTLMPTIILQLTISNPYSAHDMKHFLLFFLSNSNLCCLSQPLKTLKIKEEWCLFWALRFFERRFRFAGKKLIFLVLFLTWNNAALNSPENSEVKTFYYFKVVALCFSKLR